MRIIAVLLLSLILTYSVVGVFTIDGFIIAPILLVIAAYIRSAGSLKARVKRLCILGILFGSIFFPTYLGIVSAAKASLSGKCQNYLHELGEALLHYHKLHGHFPPAYVLGPNGKPMHSWRTLMLDYISRGDLYDAYDFNEPWNGAKNSTISSHITVLCCPASYHRSEEKDIDYVAVVGPNTAWPGSKPGCLDDLPDGGKHTILLVETIDTHIQWSEPRDLSLEEALQGINPPSGVGIGSSHSKFRSFFKSKNGAYALFADGQVRFLPDDLPTETLKALLVTDSSEQIDLDELLTWKLNRKLFFSLVSLCLSFIGLSLLPGRRRVITDVENLVSVAGGKNEGSTTASDS
jgi:hypothetical protein